jgi:F-type H+-transporting ATPase subunit epsilon
MNLKVLLPSSIFAQCDDVLRIVAETREGSFGILPHRLDCVAGLVAGILLYETSAHGTVYLAVDAGVLVKSGPNVSVAVRRVVAGSDLTELQQAIKREFLLVDAQELQIRGAMARMEAGVIGRLVQFQRGR